MTQPNPEAILKKHMNDTSFNAYNNLPKKQQAAIISAMQEYAEAGQETLAKALKFNCELVNKLEEKLNQVEAKYKQQEK